MRKINEIIKIYIFLIYLDLSLRFFGFHKVFHRLKRTLEEFDSNLELKDNLGNEIVKGIELIDDICRFYPFKAQCLHRSILAFMYLRRKLRLPFELVIGVNKYPFESHAWLMLYGQNVNELPEYTSKFNVIMSIGGK